MESRRDTAFLTKRPRYDGLAGSRYGRAGDNDNFTPFYTRKKLHYSLTVNKNAFATPPTARGLQAAEFMTNQPPGFIVAYTENYNCI